MQCFLLLYVPKQAIEYSRSLRCYKGTHCFDSVSESPFNTDACVSGRLLVFLGFFFFRDIDDMQGDNK